MLILLTKGSISVKGEKGRELKVPGDIVDVSDADADRLIKAGKAVNPETTPSEVEEGNELTQEQYDAAFDALEVLELGPEITNKLIDAGILNLEEVIKAPNKILSPIVGDDKISKNLRAISREKLKK